MKIGLNLFWVWLLGAALLLPAVVQAQLSFTTNSGAITITGYDTTAGLDVVIPATTNGYPITSIGDYAFYFCPITNVTIGTNITTIGDEAFVASGLTKVTIPNSVTSIGPYSFVCSNLTSVSIPNSVTNIGDGAFFGCPLTSVTIPNSVTNIGQWTFAACSLTSMTIPNSVTSIGDEAFSYCESLTNVTIGTNVTSIGMHAFFYCSSLTSVTIPNSVTNIGDGAFARCPLTNAYFLGDAPPDYGTAFTGYLNGDLINDPATVYYLSGTSGWGLTFGGVPAVLWNPQAKTGDGSFGVQSNKFGFSITGSSNLVIVVEAATNLASPIWSPVSTNTLNIFVGTNGTSYFSDPQWTNYPSRFYRLRSP